MFKISTISRCDLQKYDFYLFHFLPIKHIHEYPCSVEFTINVNAMLYNKIFKICITDPPRWTHRQSVACSWALPAVDMAASAQRRVTHGKHSATLTKPEDPIRSLKSFRRKVHEIQFVAIKVFLYVV